MAAAIPASSMIPYMWMVSGPRSRVPLEGEGKLARTLGTGGHILPAAPAGVRGQRSERAMRSACSFVRRPSRRSRKPYSSQRSVLPEKRG